MGMPELLTCCVECHYGIKGQIAFIFSAPQSLVIFESFVPFQINKRMSRLLKTACTMERAEIGAGTCQPPPSPST